MEAVTRAKQLRLRRLAARWLQEQGPDGRRDPVPRGLGAGGSVDVIEDAF